VQELIGVVRLVTWNNNLTRSMVTSGGGKVESRRKTVLELLAVT
jgi:hypothetical protein